MVRAAGLSIQPADDVSVNLPSFLRSLRAQAKSGRTVETYAEAVVQLDRFLVAHGMPSEIRHIRREHVESFIASLLERWKPATANNRYRGLQAFFKWLVEEDVIPESPMGKMKPPKVPEEVMEFLSPEQQRTLLRSVETGKTFEDVRDTAILRVFMGAGVRLAELANLRFSESDEDETDVFLDLEMVIVRRGKGGLGRQVGIGAKATKALDRYIRRQRAGHTGSRSQWLWLSKKGRFTESGIAQMVVRRGAAVGIKVHPHLFRHGWAHAYQAAGVSQQDLMVAGGWRTPAMLARYGAALASERSLVAQRRNNPGDKV